MKRAFLMAAFAVTPALAQMPADIAAKLKAIGPVLNPPMIQATFDIYIPKVPKAAPGVSSVEDVAYGPDERHRLDVFAPAARPGRAMLVVLFVPGGGYVAGAKNREEARGKQQGFHFHGSFPYLGPVSGRGQSRKEA